MANSPAPAILATGAGIPVNARAPVDPDPVDAVEPLEPEIVPVSELDPVDPDAPELDELGEPAAVVVVELPAVVVDVELSVDVVDDVVDDVVVVEPEVPPPGTADQTKPLGSPLLAAKVICTFQLSVSTPAPVTQATPASQTPPPPSRVGTRLWALKPGPHSRSLGKVGTRSLDATLKLSTRPSASMKPYPVEITSWATVREEIVVPWGTK